MLDARYDTFLAQLFIDVSTGDAITSQAVEFPFNEIFDDRKSFQLWDYNIKTVLADPAPDGVQSPTQRFL